MDDVIDDLALQHRELAELLEGLDPASATRATPCEGWDVIDVVLHLAQTDELAMASLRGRVPDPPAVAPTDSEVDRWAGDAVASQRVEGDAYAVIDRWHIAAEGLVDRLRDDDPHRRVVWVAGELSVHTLATTRLSEAWIHTTDVLTALGRPLRHTDRLRHIARLAWRTLPYAFALADRDAPAPVGMVLDVPVGDPWVFVPPGTVATTVTGPALDLCLLAGRRRDPASTALTAEGPDAEAVLDLIRTYA